MKREEFTKCCQAAEEGNEIYLENLGNHESGRLLYCSGGVVGGCGRAGWSWRLRDAVLQDGLRPEG
jgi:hypothetical protein